MSLIRKHVAVLQAWACLALGFSMLFVWVRNPYGTDRRPLEQQPY